MIAVFCADVGSIATGRFGWAGQHVTGEQVHGQNILQLCDHVVRALEAGSQVALGFECPLFIPLAADPRFLTRARIGEGNRPWSAGAGCGSLATGLAQAAFVLGQIKSRVPRAPAFLRWAEFKQSQAGLFLWEAFVSGAAKADSHVGDAQAGLRAFMRALPSPETVNLVHEPRVLSLIGAALLRAGWELPVAILEEPCLVVAG